MGLKAKLESEVVIKQVWTTAEVMGGVTEEARLLRNSYVEGKSGDLFLRTFPSCMIGETGTNHGSVYDYDRNIPLVFFGPGIVPGASLAPAFSVDIGTTIADLLGIPTPGNLDGKVLDLD